MIVALSGYATSGKNAAAEALIEDGWIQRGFADALKRMLFALNPLVPSGYRVQQLVNAFGWDNAKVEPEIRALLQRLGTEAGRGVLGENVWVDAAFRDLPPGRDLVLTDARFKNEADEVRARGGLVVRIVRPGVEPINGHTSERALDGYDFDAVIVNDGTIEQLHAAIRSLAGRDANRSGGEA